jgi:chromosome segregation ATPase
MVDFVQKGGLARHEESQEDALSAISRINQDLEPIFCRLELGEEVSPETVQNLRGRSQRVRAQILEMREQFKQQRQELLDKLSEKELSLRLTQSDLESIYNENKQLKEDIRLLGLKISRLEEDEKEKENLRQALSNELQSFKKKCHLLESSRERFDTNKNIFQENESLKKALFQMDEKLHLAHKQRNQLQQEYEKLLEEYERLFKEI